MKRSLFLTTLALTVGLLVTACGGNPATSAADAKLLLVAQTEGAPHEHAPAQGADPHAGHGAHDHSAHEALGASEPLPGKSLYHLAGTWLDHHGNELTLADLRGRPVVVVMFYASCDTACPILVRDALNLEAELPGDLREDTVFLMVTIDPEGDAPERLAQYVAQNDLEKDNWTFITGSHNQTRALAALLGVQYRDVGNGMFSHTNLITVLDRDGQIVQRTEGLNRPVGPAVSAISAMGAGG